jgi:2-methylisocitrate lyase-like PEP mutase family enzyme
MVLVDEAGDSDRTMVWKTRVHLLDIVDKEALFRSAGARMEDKVLRTCGEVAIKAVASASQGVARI